MRRLHFCFHLLIHSHFAPRSQSPARSKSQCQGVLYFKPPTFLQARRGERKKTKNKTYTTTTIAASWLEAGELQPWPFLGSFPPFSRHGATKTRSLGQDKGIAPREENVSRKINLRFTGSDTQKKTTPTVFSESFKI